jgi:hypothetical protein
VTAIEVVSPKTAEDASVTQYRDPAAFDPFVPPTHTTPLGQLGPRTRAAVSGTVVDASPMPWAGGEVLEVTIEDGTGSVVLAFFGRDAVAGVEPGQAVIAGGTAMAHRTRLVMLNPYVWLPTASVQG